VEIGRNRPGILGVNKHEDYLYVYAPLSILLAIKGAWASALKEDTLELPRASFLPALC
jgi:hypothetical protein